MSISHNAEFAVDDNGTFHEECRLLFVTNNGSCFAETQHDPGEAVELGWRRGGCAYFCAVCGEIWGRVVLLDSKGQPRPFDQICTVACEQHLDRWEIPGSFLSGYRNFGYLKWLPEQILRREFDLHLQYAEKES